MHVVTLSMEDAGEHGELVKEILEENKADIITACMDYRDQAEVDCALEAKDMETLSACQSVF